MAFMRRNILSFVKSSNLRFSSDNSSSSFWEIVPKQWRTPRFQTPEDSIQEKFGPSIRSVKFAGKLNIFNPPKFNFLKKNSQEESQGLCEALDDDVKQKGISVAVAQYLVYNGAKVKFSKFSEWIDFEENLDKLPKVYEMGNSLVGIDISFTDLDFLVLKATTELPSVKLFYAEGCKNFDDYCLDFISAHLPLLEELDLRHCKLITPRGLGVLYRLKYLQKLQLNGIHSDAELELLCVLLEEHFPNIKIEGITYEAIKKVETE